MMLNCRKRYTWSERGVKTDYLVKENGEVYYNNRLCVLDDKEVKNRLLYEAHKTVFTIHLGGTRI